jgi:hypothetical protein
MFVSAISSKCRISVGWLRWCVVSSGQLQNCVCSVANIPVRHFKKKSFYRMHKWMHTAKTMPVCPHIISKKKKKEDFVATCYCGGGGTIRISERLSFWFLSVNVNFIWSTNFSIDCLRDQLVAPTHTRAVGKFRGLTLLLQVGTSWGCGDGLFYEAPTLARDALLTTLHPLLQNVLHTVDHFVISCLLRAPLLWSKKPRIAWGRDMDCMADVLMGLHRSTFTFPCRTQNSIQISPHAISGLFQPWNGSCEVRNFELINGLQHVFEKWVERCKKCIACQGRYF